MRAALTEAGFGVLTEIDVKATMKKKIDKDMDGYKILGACNPNMAWEASTGTKIGAMLPACHPALRRWRHRGKCIDPVASMTAVDNAELHKVAGQVREMLVRAVDAA